MQFIKTICVLTVLGALGYGAYTTLTSSPPVEPPLDAANWDSPPDVELPAGLGPPSASFASSSPGGAAPRYNATSSTSAAPLSTPSSTGSRELTGAPSSTGPTPGTARIAPGGPITGASITNVRPLDAPSASPYPSTNVAPGPLDGGVHFAGGAPTDSEAGKAAPMTAVPYVTPPSSSSPSAPTSTQTLSGPQLASASGVVPQSYTAPTATPSTATSPGKESAAQAMQKVQTLAAENKLAEALDELSQWFDHPSLSTEESGQVQTMLDQLAGAVIYSREHLLEPPHTVAQGETLQAVAQRYQIPAELLMKINGIADPLYLPSGTQLKVLKGPFDALVDKSRGQLTLFLEGMYAGSFPIGLGLDLKLPDGTYGVSAKLVNPTFQAADGVVAADDPNNPLGERWIDLGGGQGIHGRPASMAGNLPQNGGRGMIYLSNRQDEDVYDILSVGSKVMIRP